MICCSSQTIGCQRLSFKPTPCQQHHEHGPGSSTHYMSCCLSLRVHIEFRFLTCRTSCQPAIRTPCKHHTSIIWFCKVENPVTPRTYSTYSLFSDDIQRQTMPFDTICDRKQNCRIFGFFRFFFALPLKSYMIAHVLSGPRRGCTATIIPQGDCIINQLTYLQKVFNNHF